VTVRLVKPLHLLAAADFDAAPIWGFDVALESQPGTDETWVRPYDFARVPADTDELFGVAMLAPGEMRPRRGAVCFRFERGAFVARGCALLSPTFASIDLAPRPDHLEHVLGATWTRFFPWRYDASYVIAGVPFAARGTIDPPVA
jgi:hypothetical protein